MPNIEISDEQAAALARGENVTLSPKPKGRPLKNALICYRKRVYYFVFDGLVTDDHIEFYDYMRLCGMFGPDPRRGRDGPWSDIDRTGFKLSNLVEILYEEVCGLTGSLDSNPRSP